MKRALATVAAVVLWSVGVAVAGDAPDLTKIDRRIANEPKYVSKQPLYGLYVFGPERKTRVWAVLDRSTEEQEEYDVLYFDRNANGDLTDPNERITAEPENRLGSGRTFKIGPFEDRATGDVHAELSITKRTGEHGAVFFRMKWRGEHDVMGGYAEQAGPYTEFAASPKEAPILWPGGEGPLSFQRWLWTELTIGQSGDVRVFLGHQGLGPNTFCGLHQGFLPESVPVLATLIYADREGKERREPSNLTDRC